MQRSWPAAVHFGTVSGGRHPLLSRRMESHLSPTSYSVDFAECSGLSQLGHDEIAATFGDALRRAGATIVQAIAHDFPGTGLTCVFILSESHAVLHTWPETGTINIDIFSCSPRLKSLEAINDLGRSFSARHITVQEIRRADGHGPPSDRGR
jgi:S-adenosylmethionine decarboxylase